MRNVEVDNGDAFHVVLDFHPATSTFDIIIAHDDVLHTGD